jgi:hypothetical protein
LQARFGATRVNTDTDAYHENALTF